MLMSVDGKISTGPTDDFDFDKDIPAFPVTGDGVAQYYALEKETDIWSLCTGKTQAKIGMNTLTCPPEKTNVNFVIFDYQYLTAAGVDNLAHKANKLIVVTHGDNHPAYYCRDKHDNIEIIHTQYQQPLTPVVETLYKQYGCERITLQSGGNFNGALLREGLIDYLDIVVAPIIVGGSKTPTLIGGYRDFDLQHLIKHGNLKLLECIALEHSYVHLRYKVRH